MSVVFRYIYIYVYLFLFLFIFIFFGGGGGVNSESVIQKLLMNHDLFVCDLFYIILPKKNISTQINKTVSLVPTNFNLRNQE